MPDKARLLAQIENAATSITAIWPLKTFIATNPLAGFEDRPFLEALEKGRELFGGQGLPDRRMGQKALKKGRISHAILKDVLAQHGDDPMYEAMVNATPETESHDSHPPSRLNAALIKYLAAFLDEGQAAWPMPGREKGFYKCWRDLAPYDGELNAAAFIKTLPADSAGALLQLLEPTLPEEREALFEKHLAALPGWSGFIKWRARQTRYEWQKFAPITLSDYLAVRLAMAEIMGENGLPDHHKKAQHKEGLYWLQAWEETYRQKLLRKLQSGLASIGANRDNTRPAAQLAFCIDVRSEVFRRHLEQAGPYETLGFAGFFGVPIRHTEFGEEIGADSCPVLLQPQYETTETPCAGHEHAGRSYLHKRKTGKDLRKTIKALKYDIAAPYAMVEALGALFGLGMISRTFVPRAWQNTWERLRRRYNPEAELKPTTAKTEDNGYGLSLSERIFHAEAALSIMGLTKNFAPVVVLCGHGSQTVNNPYASGLDCGACGGNHGGPNARLMAEIFNEPDVRSALRERGIDIPEDTVFIGAQHNTTTDEVELFGTDDIAQHKLADLKNALAEARHKAAEERRHRFSTPHSPDTRARDWAEVRPEWGLAGNAAFIVGGRALTRSINLEGRSFLHSYDWEADKDGKALEIILTAPMVVAEWINTQYYFSTVDNAVYGSGSKVTHNVTGKIGVMQGNASDLMSGLPLQSVMSADGEIYHEPLRLTTVVHAPLARVRSIIAENDILQHLFDHGWVTLFVIDPTTEETLSYQSGGVFRNAETGTVLDSPPAANYTHNNTTKEALS